MAGRPGRNVARLVRKTRLVSHDRRQETAYDRPFGQGGQLLAPLWSGCENAKNLAESTRGQGGQGGQGAQVYCGENALQARFDEFSQTPNSDNPHDFPRTFNSNNLDHLDHLDHALKNKGKTRSGSGDGILPTLTKGGAAGTPALDPFQTVDCELRIVAQDLVAQARAAGMAKTVKYAAKVLKLKPSSVIRILNGGRL